MKDDILDPLGEEELIRLAMKAFLVMRMSGDVSDKELLTSILTWFDLMTTDVELLNGPHMVRPVHERDH